MLQFDKLHRTRTAVAQLRPVSLRAMTHVGMQLPLLQSSEKLLCVEMRGIEAAAVLIAAASDAMGPL